MGLKTRRFGVRARVLLVLASVLAVMGASTVPVAAVPGTSAQLAALDVDGSTIVSSDAPGDPLGVSVLTSPLEGMPTQGSSALVLSTGDASALAGVSSTFESTNLGDAITGADGNDMSQFSLELSPPTGATCVAFDFLFLSEEYPNFVGSSFNDIFTAELNESFFFLDGNQVVAPNNFAFDSQGSAVSVNTLFGFSPTTQSTHNGKSPLLQATTPIELDLSSQTMTIIFSIQDLGDSIYDSAVIIDNVRYLFGPNCTAGINPLTDTDGDGLSDVWETDGIDYDNDGVPELDLPAMGADPNRADIFVEIDWMFESPTCIWFVCWGGEDFSPMGAALTDVVAAFAAAPITNPDGTTGITMHIDSGPGSVMDPDTGATWGSMSQANALPHSGEIGSFSGSTYDWTEFDALKVANFDPFRRDAFHYAVYADSLQGVGWSGISRGIPGSDYLVTQGQFTNANFTRIQERGTFMHELGHNLDLYHDGGPNGTFNYDTSYMSVMNYAYQLVGIGTTSTLDYSRGAPYDDWANIRFDGGSVGDLGDSAPQPQTTEGDSLDVATAKANNIFAAPGDGSVDVIGPSVLFNGLADQDLIVDIVNHSGADASYTLEVTGDPALFTTESIVINLPAGASTRVSLPMTVPASGTGDATLTATLSTAGTLLSSDTLMVVVTDLSDPTTRDAAQEALDELADGLPEGLDPDVAEPLVNLLETELGDPDPSCPNDVLISDYQATAPQFVEIANVGDGDVDLSECSLVVFDIFTESSSGAMALSGTIPSGGTVQVTPPELAAGPGAYGIYDGPPPADGTPFSTDGEITGMTYLNSAVVFGVGHLTVPAHNSIYACIYGGSGPGPWIGRAPFESCAP